MNKLVTITVDDENDVTFFFDEPEQTPFNVREFRASSPTRDLLAAIEALIVEYNEHSPYLFRRVTVEPVRDAGAIHALTLVATVPGPVDEQTVVDLARLAAVGIKLYQDE